MNVPLTPVRFLRYAQEQFPSKLAVVCGEKRYTYAQLGERAARLGSALRSAGLAPGDRVAFLSSNCHRFLEAYYGVLEGGGVLLPLNFRLTAPELAYVLGDSGAKFLFLESQFLETAEALRREVPAIETFVLLDGLPLKTGCASATMTIFWPAEILAAATCWNSTKMRWRNFFIRAEQAPALKA